MRSPKTVLPKGGEGGGSAETGRAARGLHANMRGQRGPGVKDGQHPHKQRHFKEVEYLHEGKVSGMRQRMQKQLHRQYVEEWVDGKRGNYK